MTKLFVTLACIAALASCKRYTEEYKQAQAENDSLRLQMKKNEIEMEDMLTVLNVVENDIQTIRSAEGLIDIRHDSELSASRREQIKNNISFITQTIQKNRQQLSELQDKLQASGLQSAALRQTIARITQDLEDKNALIVQMQAELERKDKHIRELSEQNQGLATDVQILKGVSESQKELIAEQDQEINTVYYCFGTTKELKSQNILSGGGLFSKAKITEGSFSKKYFIAADKRRLREIPLFSSKAKVMTNHPAGSYELVKDRDHNITLLIKNPDRFWSVNRFLVIVTG